MSDLFLQFNTREERQAYGGTAFMEFRYCLSDRKSAISRILRDRKWHCEALLIYIDNFEAFKDAYGEIFANAQHPDGSAGFLDECGINFYDHTETARIALRIKTEKPRDWEVLSAWLNHVPNGAGIVILGI